MSKLLGESLCQRMQNPQINIARLSNVYGVGQSEKTFLGAVIAELKKTGKVTINDAKDSVKDYVAVEDVCEMLEQIILHGQQQIYNVASGKNTQTVQIGKWMEQAGYEVTFSGQNLVRTFPQIDVTLLESEFAYEARDLSEDIQKLLEAQR